MSRALNVDATVADVMAVAAQHGAVISAIEPLLPRGTRVVFVKSTDTAIVAHAYGDRVLTGTVTRERWQQQRIS